MAGRIVWPRQETVHLVVVECRRIRPPVREYQGSGSAAEVAMGHRTLVPVAEASLARVVRWHRQRVPEELAGNRRLAASRGSTVAVAVVAVTVRRPVVATAADTVTPERMATALQTGVVPPIPGQVEADMEAARVP